MDKLKQFFDQIKQDLVLYSSKCLKIVTNDGRFVEFNFNDQQKRVHEMIENQKKTSGRVRTIILKSRKLGMSTYVAARFIHQTTLNKHKRAAVITHVADSTNAIFRVYKRFYDSIPAVLKPITRRNNAKELEFDSIDSSIKVATAGSKETGRGDTVHYLHCSEIGFWPNAREIAAGLMRSVADVDDTEIIIESTATSVDTLFYEMWQQAISGQNNYLPIFLPWTVDPTCSMDSTGQTFSPEELEYQRRFKLTNDQLYWRRVTIKQLGETKFKNEYPITANEAFAAVAVDSFISYDAVDRARSNTMTRDQYATYPLILGVDVASMGDDKTCFVWRQGPCVLKYQLFSKLTNEFVADELIKVIRRDKPAKVFIDGTGGYGGGVAAICRTRGYQVEEINFGSKSSRTDCHNKRAEMYVNLKEWLEQDVSLPDDELLAADIAAVGYKHDLMGRIQLNSKDEIKKILKRSPDTSDALALTFAYEIGPAVDNQIWDEFRNREGDYIW